MDFDLDTKDAVRQPAPPARRKRPSAVKCVIVICSLIGFFVFATIVYFMGKGFYGLYDNARNPHKDLYLNSTVVEAGIEPVAWPFIDEDETFDVYFTIWARVPDSGVVFTPEDKEAAKERFGGSWDTIKKMTKVPDDELLVNPTERVVFSEKVFEGLGMKDMNVHKDITFELPLDRFRDKLVFANDVRGAVAIIPQSGITKRVKELSGWRPEGAKAWPRLDDQIIAQLDFDDLRKELLDFTSVSFGMIELHDKNYLNETNSGDVDKESEEEDDQDLFAGDPINGIEGSESMVKRYKRWKTQQPHFVTKSHVYILDETRPMNRTAFDKKHKNLKENSCGLGMSLPPSRYLCTRFSAVHGVWEHRLVLENTAESGEDQVMYGPYVDVLRHGAGPKHVLPLPVRRGKSFDESIDRKSVTVHHQITFSAFGPGRLNLLDNFVTPMSLDNNATDAEIMEQHNTWEQMRNRGHGTHPRTRFALGLIEDIGLSLPISILSILYWYTRLTNAGIHSFAMYIISGVIFFEFLNFVYMGGKSKTVSWDMYIFALAWSGLDLFEGWLISKLVLPFELVWGDWVPKGIRRTGLTKRERATRRQEKGITWVQRGAIIIGMFATFYMINKYKLYLISPLHQTPNDHKDISMSRHLSAFLGSLKYTAVILQLSLNHQAQTFAGKYALEAYMVGARRVVQLLKFWPWFVGRYDTRGGIGWGMILWMIVEGITLWQAITLPRVEQVVNEDEDE